MHFSRVSAVLAAFFTLSPLLADESKPASPRPDIELFSLETRLVGQLKLDDPTPNTAEEDAGIEPIFLKFRVNLPWRVKTERSSFSAGLGYERLALNTEVLIEDFPDGPYHNVTLPLSFSRASANPRWGSRYFLTPGVSSDFHGSLGRGIRVQGGAMLERKNPGGALSFGLVLINDYGSPRVFPAVGWSGQVAEKQVVVVRLPVQLSWTYETSPRWSWGAAARVAGGNYAIGRPDAFRDKQLKYSAGTVGPFAKVSTGHWSATVETGYVFQHELEIRDGRHQLRDYDLRRSAFLALSLRRSLF